MAAGKGSSMYETSSRPYRVNARVPVGPTSQIGSVNAPGVLPWSQFGWIDQAEHVPELVWPTSIKTYNEMRTDSQVSGLYLGCTMPIRRYKWVVAPHGAREEYVRQFADDINLPIQGEDTPKNNRTRDKFRWDDFLRHALLSLVYGFYYFEPWGVIDNGRWRMKGLSPRPPSTVTQVDVDTQGELIKIKQAVGTQAPEIPANRLVPFVWDKEAGNWFGRSIFRSMYKHWLVKDRLIRVDAMKHDRNGLGVPVIEAPVGASKKTLEDLDRLAMSFRAGDYSGTSLPAGSKLRLVGVEGSTPDTLASINYHDEAMARSLLMMFMQLGQTKTGSRALGEQFIDYFALSQETIALWFEDIFRAYVIELWFDLNYGPDEPAPQVVHERDKEPELSVADLALLIEKGAVTVDEELETYLRDRYLLPEKSVTQPSNVVPIKPVAPPEPTTGEVVPQQPSGQAPSAVVSARRKVTKAAVGIPLLPMPQRPLRRQLYEQEVRAQVDYAAMDSDFNTARDALVTSVKLAQPKQIDQLGEKIVAAKGDLKKLAAISADPIFAPILQERMGQLAQAGANQAIAEAARQGRTVNMPAMEGVMVKVTNRAAAVDAVLSRSISEAAARKALSLSGSVKKAQAVADKVKEYLSGLSTSYLQDQLGGALQQAMNAGRREVIAEANPAQIYASELLDEATCENCVDIDGTEYPDVDAAEEDYPTGGYMECLGGPRCRGTIIAVYDEYTVEES